jgi:hypothetical protein
VLPTASGRLTVTITASNITSDGVPGNARPLDQDYALVLSNAVYAALPRSCRALGGKPSGVYDIDPDGAGPGAPFQVYCDMVNDNGGWMLVSNLYHPSPAGVVTAQAFGVPTLSNSNVALDDAKWALIKQHLLASGASLRVNGALDSAPGALFTNKAIFTKAQLAQANCGSLLGLASLRLGVMFHNEDSGCSASGLDYTWFGNQPGFWVLSALKPSVCVGDCAAPYSYENSSLFWVREEGALPRSCKDLLDPTSPAWTPGAASGLTTIDPDGSGPSQPFQVYCDQVNNGGGWMLLSTLYHPTPAGLVTSQAFGVPTPASQNVVVPDANWAALKQAFGASATFSLRVNGALDGQQGNAFINYALFRRSTLLAASCGSLLDRTSLALAVMFHDEVSGCAATGLDYTWFGNQPGFWVLSTRKPDECAGDCARLSGSLQTTYENALWYWVRE